MDPRIAKAVVLVGTMAIMAIRAPHGRRSRRVKVVKSHKTPLETGVLIVAWAGFFVPRSGSRRPHSLSLQYPLRADPLLAGVMCVGIGLWLFYRSHADLVRTGRSHWRSVSDIASSSRRLSPDSPPDVLSIGPVFRWPRTRYPELGGRSGELDRVRGPSGTLCAQRRR